MKSIFTSKTLWVNVLALAATLFGALGIDIGLTPEMQIKVVGVIMTVVNIVLRFTTKTAVSISGE